MSRKRIYLDHAATTPLDARVRRAMEPYWRDTFGNPSALSLEGAAAKKAVTLARALSARALEAHPDEIVFTSGGTESNNLVIFGVVNALHETPFAKFSGRALAKRRALNQTFAKGVSFRATRPPHIVTTNIEHASVLEPLRELVRRGSAEVSYIHVEPNGIVNPQKIIAALRPHTALVSVQYANNEIGTIQPIAKIGKLLRALSHRPLFHTDACQAPLYLHCLVNALGVDLLTLDGHKMYGPKGVGCLYVRRKTPLAPLIFGGGQERRLRATTENVPGIVGFSEALSLAVAKREKESNRLEKLRNRLHSHILQNIKITEVLVNGSMKEGERLPNNLNISLPGIDTEMLTLQLDAADIACSTKSSCLQGERKSYVVQALGGDASRATSTLRFTIGRGTTKNEVDYVTRTLAYLLCQK